jgi:hypothetical protein
MVGMLLSSMDFMYPVRNERCTPASVAPNARCLEGLLLVFDSGYSSVSILVADDHLPGPRTILNDFLQIFFALAGLNLPLCAKFLRAFGVVWSMYLWLGYRVYKVTLYCLLGSSDKSSTMCNRVSYL